MLVSHTYKFIIVNIPKTGCTSILNSILKHISIDIMGDANTKGYYQHDTALCIKEKLNQDGFKWNDYISYVRVRNPWSRYVSYCLWLQKNLKYYPIAKKHFEKNGYNFQKILKYYIQNIIEPQHLFLLDGDNCIVTHVDEFENLNNHFIKFCKNHNFTELNLLHLNKNKPYFYRDFYNQELIDLVAEKESYVIENYKYQY